MSSKPHPLIYVLTALVSVNLVLTMWLAVGTLQQATVEEAGGKELPSSLSASVRERILEEFQNNFNANDYDAIFEMFDAYARVQLEQEEITGVMKSLHDGLGGIRESSYSHYEYIGFEDGRDWYKLYFILKVDGGSYGRTRAELNITIFYDGENHGIVEFYLGT